MLEAEYPGEMRALYLGFSREYVLKAYESGIIAHRSDVERRGYDEERTPEQSAQEHEVVGQPARRAARGTWKSATIMNRALRA